MYRGSRLPLSGVDMETSVSISDSETGTSRREDRGLGVCGACKYMRGGGMGRLYLIYICGTRLAEV